MNLQEICKKYSNSDNFLNSKDDALLVTAASLDDIILELNPISGTTTTIEKLERLKHFLVDVKTSGV
jgi:hypothetical protein